MAKEFLLEPRLEETYTDDGEKDLESTLGVIFYRLQKTYTCTATTSKILGLDQIPVLSMTGPY